MEKGEDNQLKNRMGIKAMKLEALNEELDCVLQQMTRLSPME